MSRKEQPTWKHTGIYWTRWITKYVKKEGHSKAQGKSSQIAGYKSAFLKEKWSIAYDGHQQAITRRLLSMINTARGFPRVGAAVGVAMKTR